jgi:hypothetical protein
MATLRPRKNRQMLLWPWIFTNAASHSAAIVFFLLRVLSDGFIHQLQQLRVHAPPILIEEFLLG